MTPVRTTANVGSDHRDSGRCLAGRHVPGRYRGAALCRSGHGRGRHGASGRVRAGPQHAHEAAVHDVRDATRNPRVVGTVLAFDAAPASGDPRRLLTAMAVYDLPWAGCPATAE